MKVSDRGARASILVLIILVLGSLIVFIPKETSVDAVGGAAVTIQLHQTQQVVQVAPGQPGVLMFTGEIRAQVPWSPRIQYLLVSLTYEASGWATSGTSVVIFTRADNTMPFTCTVKVPPMTSHQVVGTLNVIGRWNYQPGITGGPVNPVQAIIIVDQFYQFSVGCEKPYLQVSPGDSLGFRMRLINEGNSIDRLRMEITNLAELNQKGWTVQLSQDQFQVPEVQERVVTVSVTTPVKTIIWKNDVDMIRLRVVSSQAEQLGKVSYPSEYSLYIRQKGFQIPGFEPAIAIIALVLLATLLYGTARKRQ